MPEHFQRTTYEEGRKRDVNVLAHLRKVGVETLEKHHLPQ